MSNIAVCINCISVIGIDDVTCPVCEEQNKLYKNHEFVRFTTDYYFNACVRRAQLEHDIETLGDDLNTVRIERATIDPTVIFGFIASLCITGLAWDVIKIAIRKLYDSLDNNSTLLNGVEPHEKIALENAKKELAFLLENDAEIQSLVQRISEYRNNYVDNDVHEYVKAETEFSDEAHLKPYEDILAEIKKSLESYDKDDI